jgi:hypothetical protein
MWTIYCHIHIVSGRCYVGLTKKTVLERWNQHVYTSTRLAEKGWSHFANAIRKYGKDAFQHEVLTTCDTLETANAAEQEWIEKLGTRDPEKGFNLAKGGNHVPHPMRNPWDRPGFRERHRTATQAAMSRPDRRLQNSIRMKLLLSEPSEIERLSKQGREISFRPGMREALRTRWRDSSFATKCSLGIIRGAEQERSKTHCPAGHEYSPDNTYFGSRHYRGSVYRTRICKTCFNARTRAKYAVSPPPKAICACGSPRKKTSKRCPPCHYAYSFGKNERVTWPSLEELTAMVETIGRSGIAKKLGVSFQAVTQKLKRHARHAAL